ncbi:MAG: hypothetical protein HY238_16490 [Acidobacteria bacterium]|nr:hypothetical protein [Acidobacteriota bacterium]
MPSAKKFLAWGVVAAAALLIRPAPASAQRSHGGGFRGGAMGSRGYYGGGFHGGAAAHRGYYGGGFRGGPVVSRGYYGGFGGGFRYNSYRPYYRPFYGGHRYSYFPRFYSSFGFGYWPFYSYAYWPWWYSDPYYYYPAPVVVDREVIRYSDRDPDPDPNYDRRDRVRPISTTSSSYRPRRLDAFGRPQ